MNEFKYKTSRTVGGYAWYCQEAGKVWKTDPIIGYELEFRRRNRVEGGDTGWHLYGHGFFGEYAGRTFKEALENVVDLINVNE